MSPSRSSSTLPLLIAILAVLAVVGGAVGFVTRRRSSPERAAVIQQLEKRYGPEEARRRTIEMDARADAYDQGTRDGFWWNEGYRLGVETRIVNARKSVEERVRRDSASLPRLRSADVAFGLTFAAAERTTAASITGPTLTVRRARLPGGAFVELVYLPVSPEGRREPRTGAFLPARIEPSRLPSRVEFDFSAMAGKTPDEALSGLGHREWNRDGQLLRGADLLPITELAHPPKGVPPRFHAVSSLQNWHIFHRLAFDESLPPKIPLRTREMANRVGAGSVVTPGGVGTAR